MPVLAAFAVPHPPLIIPDVGRGGERAIEETKKAYERVADEIAALKPETIILFSPHSVMYSDYFHISPGSSATGSFKDFRAPGVKFKETYDSELRDMICSLADEKGFPAGTLGERDRFLDHGTMVPLYFVEQKYTEFRLIRIGLSGLPLTDHYRLGMIINEAVEKTGRRAVIIASGDLSHKLKAEGPYGYAPEGPEYDRRIMDTLSRASFGELFGFDETFCDKAAECGHRSFVIMAGAFDGRKVTAEALSHQDVTGVGYGVCIFYPGDDDPDRHFLESYLAKTERELDERRASEDPYVKLARRSLESYVLYGKMITVPDDAPEELTKRRAGAFVSLHEHGRLRGCIGTILPTASSLAKEIIGNAVSAAVNDPRFDPVKPEELKWLEISVDVLGEPESCTEDMLDVKRYGVIVESKGRRGLLLPDLDGVDTVGQQIEIARRKAGIRKNEEVKLSRFEVVRHY